MVILGRWLRRAWRWWRDRDALRPGEVGRCFACGRAIPREEWERTGDAALCEDPGHHGRLGWPW